MNQIIIEQKKYWLGGFIAGEGSFGAYPKLYENRKNQLTISFVVEVNKNDTKIITLLQKTINCGNVKDNFKRNNIIRFYICNKKDIINKLIPFCDKYLLESHKKKQYKTWKKEIIKYYKKRDQIKERKKQKREQIIIKKKQKIIKSLEEGLTLQEIGKNMGITRQRVHQIKNSYPQIKVLTKGLKCV